MQYGAASGKLLLVEDNPGDAMLIQEFLAEDVSLRGRVVHVWSFAEGMANLMSRDVAAVLLDLRLPDRSGLACVTEMRARFEDVPIVVLTGMEDEDLALSCISAGAQDYVLKQDLRGENLRRAIAFAIARSAMLVAVRRADSLETRLAAVVSSSSDAILSCAVDGIVTTWNAGAARIFGYREEEAVGRHVGDVIQRRGADSGNSKHPLLALKPDGAVTSDVIKCVRKNGRTIALSVSVSAMRDSTGEIQGFSAICRDITEEQRRERAFRSQNRLLQARDREMRALTARLNALREQERTRLSRQVHDELGQLLTGLKMALRLIARGVGAADMPSAKAILAKIAETEEIIDLTVEAVQRIAVELRPSVLDKLGLEAALRDEARRFEGQSGIASKVVVTGSSRPTPTVATELFRIAQELLTNVARHAQADSVRISLDARADELILQVEDNGVGLRRDLEGGRPSLGILGIRERAAFLGGTFSLASGTERGAVATVRVPTMTRHLGTMVET